MSGAGPAADDSRGVAPMIGFMLVFALVVALLGILQVTAVPTWNEQVEQAHSERVQSDLLDLQDDVLAVAATGRDRSQTVRTGVRYPNRPMLLGPPPSTGTLRTAELGAVQFDNAQASGETGDFWTGAERDYPTRSIVYAPDYNQYESAPRTTIENGLVVDRFESADRPRTGQQLVDGRRISLVTMTGSFDAAGLQRSVGISAASAPTRTVAVTNADSPIAITVPTRLPVGVWQDRLADQRIDNGGHVQAVDDVPGDAVEVVLEPGVTYELELAKVALDGEPTGAAPAYVTDVVGAGESVPEGGSQRLVVEVRDRFNGPVSGVEVTAEVVSGPGSVTAVSATTDSDGRAVFEYAAGSGTGTAEVQVRYAATPTAEQQVTYAVDVYGTGGGGGGGVGTGGESQWSAADDTETLSAEGGLWRGIDGAGSLVLSEPQFTPLTEQGSLRADREYLRFTFAVRKGDTTYLVDVKDGTDGLARTLGGEWGERRVVIYRRVGDDRYTTLGSADLQTTQLETWYQGQGTIDLLAQPSYDGNHGGANALRQFMRTNEDVEIYVVEMDGRVTLTAR